MRRRNLGQALMIFSSLESRSPARGRSCGERRTFGEGPGGGAHVSLAISRTSCLTCWLSGRRLMMAGRCRRA